MVFGKIAQHIFPKTTASFKKTILEETQKGLPFVEFMPSPEAALAQAQRKFPGRAEVLVLFPHGGITYPDLG